MGSYSDEGYSRTSWPSSGSSGSSSFFKPKPTPSAPPSRPSSTPSSPKTVKASSVRPPVTVTITKPQGKINLLLAFDVSSSMGEARQNVRNKAKYFHEEITKLLPELAGDMEISFFGVSDHCDGSHMLQPTSFSKDVATLTNNIENIVDANGGDIPEAFECLFKTVNGWPVDDANVIVVLVSDSIPHGMGFSEDHGCPDGVDYKKELVALKKKVRAFYFISCKTAPSMKKLQRQLVDDEQHFIDLGSDFWRLTNVVHGIIAQELGELGKYLANLQATRGVTRAEEVKTLLKTKTS